MRIIASKQNQFGSKTFVVLSCNKIHMVETIGGVEPRTLRSPEISFHQVHGVEFFGKSECAYGHRELWRCASGARRAMRLHK